MGGLTTLYSAPIVFLIGGIMSLVAAIVGWMLRKPAEKKPRSVNGRHDDRVIGILDDIYWIVTERKNHCLMHRPIRTWPF